MEDALRTTIKLYYLATNRKLKGDFLRETGLSPKTVRAAIEGTRCSYRTAKALAKAFGQLSRFQELIVDTEEKP